MKHDDMAMRRNLFSIVNISIAKALSRAAGGNIPCIADRYALALEGMSEAEMRETLRRWIAADTAGSTLPARIRAEIAASWLGIHDQ